MVCLRETERSNTPLGGRLAATLAALVVPFPLGCHLLNNTLAIVNTCVCLKILIKNKSLPGSLLHPPFKAAKKTEQGKKHCPAITLILALPDLVVIHASTLARKG